MSDDILIDDRPISGREAFKARIAKFIRDRLDKRDLVTEGPIDMLAHIAATKIVEERERTARMLEGAFEQLVDALTERPRPDPCPHHYTGDPELPCRCMPAQAAAEKDVVVHPPPARRGPYDFACDNILPEDHHLEKDAKELKSEDIDG